MTRRITLTLCINVRDAPFASCGARGSLALRDALEKEIAARRLAVDFQTIRCLGKCEQGPNARLAPANRWFHHLRTEDVPILISELEKADDEH
jgi:NADH:ubiquinone oxidoreductase subunit E